MADGEHERLIAEAVQATLEQLQGPLADLSARISVISLLLEVAYANSFVQAPLDFAALMDRMVEQTRSSTVKAHAMSTEELVELQASMATHLIRFRTSVLRRIESGR